MPPVDVAPPPPPDAAVPATLAVGLVSRWKLDDRSGTMALDSAGAANVGMVSGATWETTGFPAARYANAGSLRFDGVNDFVELGVRNLPAHNGAKSAAFWVNFAQAPAATARSVFVSLSGGNMGATRLKFGFKDARLSAWRTGMPIDLATAPTAGPAPGWHHYAYTFDGTIHRLYLDGARLAMSTAAPTTGAVTRARLGANIDNTERFAGQIDEVRIYNRALTDAEISELSSGFE